MRIIVAVAVVLTGLTASCAGSDSAPADTEAGVDVDLTPDAAPDGTTSDIAPDSDAPDAVGDTSAPDSVPDSSLPDGISDTAEPLDSGADSVSSEVDLDADPGVDVLTGDPSGSAIASLPSLAIPLPDPDQIVDVDVLSLARDRVVLALSDDATVGDVNLLARSMGARLIGTLPELGLIVLAPPEPTTDLTWVAAALSLADQSPAVAIAAPSAIEQPQIVPPAHASPAGWSWADDSGSDWGLHFIRAPLAWNLRRYLRAQPSQPRVVVLDGAFNPHPDVTFDATTPLGPAAVATHGTSVAGVIAAHWDAVGIEGVLPVPTTIHGRTATIFPYPAENALAVLVAEMAAARAAAVPLIINMSLGHNLFSIVRNPDGSLKLAYQLRPDQEIPGLGESFGEVAERTGHLFRRLSRYATSGGGYDRWLMLCSAGNSNVNAALKAQAAGANVTLALADVVAKYNSGCAFAAAEGDAHFMSVEALAVGGQGLADFSSRGGTIAAPGQGIGLVSGSGYATQDGTSFSSPLVAGAAALLWSYDPAASFGEIRAALLTSATAGVGGSAARLDLWAALAHRAAHGGPDLGLLLADVDDGSADGLSRILPNGSAAPVVSPDKRGDGCVDIADFRALRDALFDVTAPTGYRVFGLVPGVSRDQNGDGVTSFTTNLTERRHSRFDLDGSGAVDTADLAVLASGFGSCVPGAGPAVTEGFAAADLSALLASVDLFLRLPAGSGDLRFVAPGRADKRISEAEVAARSVLDHLVATLPASSCDGGLDLRLERADGTVRTYTTPAGDLVELGRDYVLDGIVASAVDRTTPLVHTHTGPHVYEAIVYATTGEAQGVADLEPPFLAAPTFPDDLGVRHSRAAATETGGRVAIVTDGVARSWKIAGTNSDLAALAWSADGQGLLLGTTFGSRRLFWLDLLREASAEIGPGLGIGDAWPQVSDGFVIFVTTGGLLMRAPTYADDQDWSASVLETAQCGTSYTLAPPESILDLTAFGAVRDVVLPRAYPGALSDDARRLALMARRGAGWDLQVLSLTGPDAGSTLTVATGWEPRGGFDTFNLDASDGVAWSADASLFAYAMPDGVYLATLGTGDLPGVLAAPIKVHDAPAAIAFDPTGRTLLAVVSEGPVAARTARLHVYRAPWGGAAQGIYLHEHRHGAIVVAADGEQIAVVQKDGSKGDVVVYAPPSMSPIATTASWSDPCGTTNCTTTSEIMPAWARDIWPW